MCLALMLSQMLVGFSSWIPFRSQFHVVRVHLLAACDCKTEHSLFVDVSRLGEFNLFVHANSYFDSRTLIRGSVSIYNLLKRDLHGGSSEWNKDSLMNLYSLAGTDLYTVILCVSALVWVPFDEPFAITDQYLFGNDLKLSFTVLVDALRVPTYYIELPFSRC